MWLTFSVAKPVENCWNIQCVPFYFNCELKRLPVCIVTDLTSPKQRVRLGRMAHSTEVLMCRIKPSLMTVNASLADLPASNLINRCFTTGAEKPPQAGLDAHPSSGKRSKRSRQNHISNSRQALRSIGRINTFLYLEGLFRWKTPVMLNETITTAVGGGGGRRGCLAKLFGCHSRAIRTNLSTDWEIISLPAATKNKSKSIFSYYVKQHFLWPRRWLQFRWSCVQ